MDSKNPTFTEPDNTLKQKVGEGGIPAYLIKKCQDFLESNPVDFTPYAQRFLQDMEDIARQIEKEDVEPAAALARIVNIIMQLKSNGSMFHYQLLSMTSDVMLRFLENVKGLDQDFLDILAVYTRIVGIILNKRLNGTGGREGYLLTQELHGACLRYYSKYAIQV
ncbi:MAG: hypothetical protein DI551_12090 [Micavibrio aeruginosavorus]|uniref:Uncharacterized protein n=1 Tax=Micavibrio aeruginosavorus TaxID=349221 RepID=A0A2W5PG00_9BACT|nr:MAG: hypothetical protein DI551_12090 [Micavibrio aeruginosavorus]